MKYEVKGLTSYGVYDGDRLLRTYESEKAATLVAEALNEEAAVGQSVVSPPRPTGPYPPEGEGWITATPENLSDAFDTKSFADTPVLNGQDKETI